MAFEECSKIGGYFEMKNIEFLKILYGKVPEGYVGVSYIIDGKIKTKWFAVSELEDMAVFIDETGKEYNTYYGVNPRREKLPYYVRGSDKDISYVIGVQMDFDVKGEAHKQKALPETKEELLSYIETLPINPSLLVWSGNGVHAIWLFVDPYRMTEDTLYINQILKGWELYVNTDARKKNGWVFDSVADTARMLRAPGTVNRKTEEKPMCEVISYSGYRYSPGDFEGYIKASTTMISGANNTAYDTDDFACMGVGDANELIEKCEFLKHCEEDAVNLSEQHWFGAISNLACCSNGKEVIHKISEPYPTYSYEETERKFLNAVNQDKPFTCKRIHEALGFKCSHDCGVKAPISLIRDCIPKVVTEWEKPIPFDSFKLPEFPIEALPEPIADYVLALAESTQTPVDMAATSAIAIMSVCLQGKYCIKAKADWAEPLNTFVLNVMEPSERKSAVENAMVRPINIYEAEQNMEKSVEIEKSKTRKQILEQRQRALVSQAVKGKVDREEVDKVSEELATFREVKPVKLYVDDVTTEKLTSVLSDNEGRIAILSTEGGIFDTLSGIYTKNVNIDVILKGYSGDSIRVDRIGRQSESIMHPALTMLLMAQPSVLSGLMSNGTFRGRGLTARFLYCIPTSKVGSRKYRSAAVPLDTYNAYELRIRNLLEDEYEKEPEFITLSPEADVLIEQFAENLEPMLKTEYAEISDWAGKLVGNILRIAGLLCRASVYRDHTFLAVNESLVVTEEIMTGAIAIGAYFVEHAKAAFALMGADETVKLSRYVLSAIEESGLAEVTRRDVQRMCRSFKRADDLQPILDNLVDYGYLCVLDNGGYKGKGRPPAMKYGVNPYLYENKN